MRVRLSRGGRRRWVPVLLLWALWGLVGACAVAQSGERSAAAYRLRAGRFLAGREGTVGTASGGAAAALAAARRQHAALLAEPRVTAFSAPWQAVGPGQVASEAYGAVTGRVTAVAIDPADATGNTVYVGTTGGGVWKAANAAGPAASVSFAPLTDTIPAFSGNAGTAAIPSLSIGALSVGSTRGRT